MTEHTTMLRVSRLEVVETGARRRWTIEEKRRTVAESEAGARQVSATARRYGLSPAHLFTWRRLAREGGLGDEEDMTFARAVIACEETPPTPPRPTPSRTRIEIVLRDGLRVMVDATLDAGALAHLHQIIKELQRHRFGRQVETLQMPKCPQPKGFRVVSG